MIETQPRYGAAPPPAIKNIPLRPTGGMWKYDQEREFPENASPDMLNCYVFEGKLRKRPGFTGFPSGMSSLGGSITGIYSTQDDENNTHLLATHPTGAAKYDFGTNTWTAMTGTALTGAADQWMSFENSQNSIVFCQGVDKIQRHDISTANTNYAVLDANAPIARYLTRFANRLMAAYTIEGGVSKPFRIRRPVSDDHTNWTGSGSGFNDQVEYPYHLRGIRKLGEMMVAYTERSIHLATRTGQALAPFSLKPKTEAVGLYGERTLRALPGSAGHIFMGNDDVYVFNGVQERGVGMPIRDYIFNNVTPSAIRANFAELLSDTQEYLMFAAQSSATTPNYVWVYNYGRNVWYPWSCSGPTCATLVRNDDTTTIDSLIGTIDQQTWEFDSRVLESAYPALITGNTDGKVYKWGAQYPSDNGTAIQCYWTSRDLESDDIMEGIPPHRITIRSLGVKYVDTGSDLTLQVSYSTDGGASWIGPYDLECPTHLTGGTHEVFITKQVTGERIRFKILNETTDESFQIIEFNAVLELREPIYS